MALEYPGRSFATSIPLSISDSTKSITASPRAPASRTNSSETVTVVSMCGDSPIPDSAATAAANQARPVESVIAAPLRVRQISLLRVSESIQPPML
jgi:hypothetical protein